MCRSPSRKSCGNADSARGRGQASAYDTSDDTLSDEEVSGFAFRLEEGRTIVIALMRCDLHRRHSWLTQHLVPPRVQKLPGGFTPDKEKI